MGLVCLGLFQRVLETLIQSQHKFTYENYQIHLWNKKIGYSNCSFHYIYFIKRGLHMQYCGTLVEVKGQLWFSVFYYMTLKNKPRSPCLAARAFTCWATSPTQTVIFKMNILTQSNLKTQTLMLTRWGGMVEKYLFSVIKPSVSVRAENCISIKKNPSVI